MNVNNPNNTHLRNRNNVYIQSFGPNLCYPDFPFFNKTYLNPLAQQPLAYYFPTIYINQPFVMCQVDYKKTEQVPLPKNVDLDRFKIRECSIKTYHDHKQCTFYHSGKDRRRNLKFRHYEPEMCPSIPDNNCKCTKGDSCEYSHNTVEQFYHPKKYKTKLCTHYSEKETNCIYGNFCSFAHNINELKIEKLHLEKKDLEFLIYKYKTVYCPFNKQHDKSLCQYAHNVQDFRRDPKKYKYKAEVCRKWNVSSEISNYSQGGCPSNINCTNCHGWKEMEYHPNFYKTRPCINQDSCSRVDCGYYHSKKDKRVLNCLYGKKNLGGSQSTDDVYIVSRKNNFSNQSLKIGSKCSSKEGKSLALYQRSPHITLKGSNKKNTGTEKFSGLLTTMSTQFKCQEYQSKSKTRGYSKKTPNNHGILPRNEEKHSSLVTSSLKIKRRKFSENTFAENNHKNRFCLRSEDESSIKNCSSLMFWSPLKMRAEFGPDSKISASFKTSSRTCPTSPNLGELRMQSFLSKQNDISLSEELETLMHKLKLTQASLMELDDRDIEQLLDVNEFEKNQLRSWRDKLVDENCDQDIFKLIDDFNVSQFNRKKE